MDEIVARYQISQEKNEYRLLDDALSQEVYVIGFKKGNIALKDKVENVLQQMSQDGSSSNISAKWFGEDILLKD